jgi:hypothetical protein
MRKKRGPPKKIRPPKSAACVSVVDITLPPFHITFPITLNHKTENKLCYFKDETDMNKYIQRCKLGKKEFTVSPTKPKTHEEE